MFEELDKYKSNGHFFFSENEELKSVCNAPINGIGVYVVYALKGGKIELIYIGSSGKILQSGKEKNPNWRNCGQNSKWKTIWRTSKKKLEIQNDN